MVKAICNLIWWAKGWKLEYNDSAELRRCVLIAAPHTSNWDFPLTIASFSKMKIPYRFTIKKEWMKFPFNLIMKPLGGLGIDRNPKLGKPKRKMVDVMADLFDDHDELCMVVTPEGTRKKATKWKTGFFYVARQANVPVAIGFVDYSRKVAGIKDVFYLSDDLDAEMKKIMSYYDGLHGKFPEKFSLDLRYA